jgi:hypothetical protein
LFVARAHGLCRDMDRKTIRRLEGLTSAWKINGERSGPQRHAGHLRIHRIVFLAWRGPSGGQAPNKNEQ